MMIKFGRVMRLFVCVTVLAVGVPETACPAQDAPAARARPAEHPAGAIAELRLSHPSHQSTFVIQGELDCLIAPDGGGGCASAAAVDALQTLRVMTGAGPVSNPHQAALRAFKEQPELLKGRVTNPSFVKLLEHYGTYLGEQQLGIAVISAPNSSHATSGRRWSGEDGPNLKAKSGQLKVLSYTVTEASGNVLGRHFVLLADTQQDEIEVLDPSSPLKPRRYVLDFQRGPTGPRERVFLLNPPGVPARTLVFELNTIFRVKLKAPSPTKTSSPQPHTVEAVNRRLDELASELKGTPDWQAPLVWRARSASFGLPGLDLPAQFGGSDWPATKMIEVFRHAGRHNLNFRDIVGGAHVRALKDSTDPAVQGIVRDVVQGKAYVAIAITEPDVGSNVPAMTSTSRKVEGGYRLTGEKRYNARLEQATHVILFTQGTTGVAGKLNVFVLPIKTPGLEVEHLTPHGLTGNSYGGLKFQDVFVPESARIGADGEGTRLFFKHFLYWRLMQTAAAIGTGEDALRQMAERLKTREAFGGPIGRFTHLQQPLGQHAIELKMAYSLAEDAARRLDQGDYDSANALICGLKAEGVEISLQAVDAAVRAFGGEGYSTRVDLGDRLRDLNGLRIADGTTDVMRSEVVRRLYGAEFWEMAIKPKAAE